MYLSAQASHVYMLIRGPHISSTMSDYLVQRIHASKAITLYPCSEEVRLGGNSSKPCHMAQARYRRR
jgi:thioredoxin reductase (NADPH)